MDRYTKVVLTVIAAALSAIVFQNSGAIPAIAQGNQQPVKVVICNYDGTKCATTSGNGGEAFGYGLPRVTDRKLASLAATVAIIVWPPDSY
jgi:hypothetical protein